MFYVILGQIGSILGQKSAPRICIKYDIVYCAYCVFYTCFSVLNVSEVRMAHPCIFSSGLARPPKPYNSSTTQFCTSVQLKEDLLNVIESTLPQGHCACILWPHC